MAWNMLRDTLGLKRDGVPDDVDRRAVAGGLAVREGVADVHDPHLRVLSTTRAERAAPPVRDLCDLDAPIVHHRRGREPRHRSCRRPDRGAELRRRDPVFARPR